MTKLLKLEELAQFLLSIVLFSQLSFSWWMFPACLLLPDFSMLGYVINNKIGAWSYNLFHHKLLGIIFYVIGVFIQNETIMLIGIILFGHSAMDRVFGYGLKYKDDFKHTHLGKIG